MIVSDAHHANILPRFHYTYKKYTWIQEFNCETSESTLTCRSNSDKPLIILDHKKTSFGKILYSNNIIFEGNIIDLLPNGYGTLNFYGISIAGIFAKQDHDVNTHRLFSGVIRIIFIKINAVEDTYTATIPSEVIESLHPKNSRILNNIRIESDQCYYIKQDGTHILFLHVENKIIQITPSNDTYKIAMVLADGRIVENYDSFNPNNLKITHNNGHIYSGSVNYNFEPDGEVTIEFPEDDLCKDLKGIFENGNIVTKSQVTITYKNGNTYTGPVDNETFLPNGPAIIAFPEDDLRKELKGTFENGNIVTNSQATITYKNGTTYTGFVNVEFHLHGKWFKDGTKFIGGVTSYGNLELIPSKGMLTLNDGRILCGNFCIKEASIMLVDNKPCTIYYREFIDNNLKITRIYKGSIFNNKPQGFGTIVEVNRNCTITSMIFDKGSNSDTPFQISAFYAPKFLGKLQCRLCEVSQEKNLDGKTLIEVQFSATSIETLGHNRPPQIGDTFSKSSDNEEREMQNCYKILDRSSKVGWFVAQKLEEHIDSATMKDDIEEKFTYSFMNPALHSNDVVLCKTSDSEYGLYIGVESKFKISESIALTQEQYEALKKSFLSGKTLIKTTSKNEETLDSEEELVRLIYNKVILNPVNKDGLVPSTANSNDRTEKVEQFPKECKETPQNLFSLKKELKNHKKITRKSCCCSIS